MKVGGVVCVLARIIGSCRWEREIGDQASDGLDLVLSSMEASELERVSHSGLD